PRQAPAYAPQASARAPAPTPCASFPVPLEIFASRRDHPCSSPQAGGPPSMKTYHGGPTVACGRSHGRGPSEGQAFEPSAAACPVDGLAAEPAERPLLVQLGLPGCLRSGRFLSKRHSSCPI